METNSRKLRQHNRIRTNSAMWNALKNNHYWPVPYNPVIVHLMDSCLKPKLQHPIKRVTAQVRAVYSHHTCTMCALHACPTFIVMHDFYLITTDHSQCNCDTGFWFCSRVSCLRRKTCRKCSILNLNQIKYGQNNTLTKLVKTRLENLVFNSSMILHELSKSLSSLYCDIVFSLNLIGEMLKLLTSHLRSIIKLAVVWKIYLCLYLLR